MSSLAHAHPLPEFTAHEHASTLAYIQQRVGAIGMHSRRVYTERPWRESEMEKLRSVVAYNEETEGPELYIIVTYCYA